MIQYLHQKMMRGTHVKGGRPQKKEKYELGYNTAIPLGESKSPPQY
jgi:hypothetical protein